MSGLAWTSIDLRIPIAALVGCLILALGVRTMLGLAARSDRQRANRVLDAITQARRASPGGERVRDEAKHDA